MSADGKKAVEGPSRKEMSTWDVDKRLSRIQQIYIKHPQVTRVGTQLDLHWKHGLRLREATTSFIVGHSRCGKSETLKRFVKSKTGMSMPKTSSGTCLLVEGNDARIVYLDTMNGATPLQASISILANLFQFKLKITENQASEKLIHFFGLAGVDLFVIDEGQKMIGADGVGRAADKFVNWLLSLENAGKFRIVVSGGPELQNTIDTHPMVRDRKDAVQHLKPFAHATDVDRAAFRNFLTNFDGVMPFESTPLSQAKLQDAFFFACRGRPGKLAKLMEKATQIAFLRSEDKPMNDLTVGHLSEAFSLSLLSESQMLGVNPFDHEGALPSIPLSIEQEETDDPELFRSKRATRSKASRISKRPK